MTDRIADIRAEAERAIAAATDTAALEDVRIQYLGRKAELPNLLRNVASLPPQERAATGKAANEARKALEAAIEQRAEQLAARRARAAPRARPRRHHAAGGPGPASSGACI